MGHLNDRFRCILSTLLSYFVSELKQLFADVSRMKQQKIAEKLEATALTKKRMRRRLCSKLNRAKMRAVHLYYGADGTRGKSEPSTPKHP
jgi:hypothetical protein